MRKIRTTTTIKSTTHLRIDGALCIIEECIAHESDRSIVISIKT